MATEDREEIRRGLVRLMMEKIANDDYPSVSMMNMVEALLRPEEAPAYVAVLAEKVQRDDYPSIPMLRRLMELA